MTTGCDMLRIFTHFSPFSALPGYISRPKHYNITQTGICPTGDMVPPTQSSLTHTHAPQAMNMVNNSAISREGKYPRRERKCIMD